MHRILSFLNYFLFNINEHSLHSPFVYDLYTKIIKPSRKQKGNTQYEKYRKALTKEKTILKLNDLGTGNKNKIAISETAKRSLSSAKKSNLLVSLGNYFESEVIVELGTSLGINALYLSDIENSQVYTFEGDENRSKIARSKFDELNKNNIKLIKGNIDKTLMSFLNDGKRLDLVFFDANHAYQPTLNYYNTCIPHKKDSTVFILDDIYYSAEMTKAWKEIIDEVEVTLSIDLYSVGILFFDPSFKKKHYILEY